MDQQRHYIIDANLADKSIPWEEKLPRHRAIMAIIDGLAKTASQPYDLSGRYQVIIASGDRDLDRLRDLGAVITPVDSPIDFSAERTRHDRAMARRAAWEDSPQADAPTAEYGHE